MKFDVKKGEEAQKSELPALELLVALGYDYKPPRELYAERPKDYEALLYDRLEKAIKDLNPWLTDANLKIALDKIKEKNFPKSANHVDTNEKIHAMLTSISKSSGLERLTVEQNLGHGLEEQEVQLFNFEEPEKNDFLVTNQFMYQGNKTPIIPDIVVFVNGIPLVVIECKSPSITKPIDAAVEQLYDKYQYGDGYDRLFFYNLFMIATCGQYAKHGCIDADVNFYAKWSSTYPYTEAEVKKLAKGRLREQEILIAGMLNKKTIINLLENFVIYDKEDGAKIKKLSKHQQFRTVSKCIARMSLPGKKDSQKGGVVWHSQGSGKSLTMMWLSKQIMKNFEKPPMLIVTDRKSLDKQIHRNFINAGYRKPIRVKDAKELAKELQNPRNKTIMTTLQKFGQPTKIQSDAKMYVLTDESHRSEYKKYATKMRNSLPNATFFAFTATPIDKPHRKTFEKFGDEIDAYTWKESKDDGATVAIVYQGRLPEHYISEGDSIETIFNQDFSKFTKAQRNKIKKDKVTLEAIERATDRINVIAKDIVTHFNKSIGINGFKAMLVASSKEAAVRYKTALDSIPGAPKSKIIMSMEPNDKGLDGKSWKKYYIPPGKRESEAETFATKDDENQILIVVDMLLTGYDAPIVQAMYLDHRLREHTLIQAIARVNRKYKNKSKGYIIDYCGIAKELDEAQKMFSKIQTQGLITQQKDLLTPLKLAHKKAMTHLKDIDANDDDAVVTKFAKPDLRETFWFDYGDFEQALDAVMPEPEAEPFMDDFAKIDRVKRLIKNWLDRDKFSTKPYSQKVQKLLDAHIKISGITQIIDETEINDENFLSQIKPKKKRAQTALVKTRIGSVILEKYHDNPAFFEKIQDRLDEIIKAEKDRRLDDARILSQLTKLWNDILAKDTQRKKLGLENEFEFALYGKLESIKNDSTKSVSTSKDIYKKIHPLTEIIDWKQKTKVYKKMKELMYDTLTAKGYPEKDLEKLVDEVIDLAKRLIS